MMFFIKTLFYPLITYVKNVQGILRLKHKYKNLKLRGVSTVVNSSFGNYNYLSNNVSVINSSLGDFSYVGINSFLQNALVGKFVCIGPNVQIGLGDHPLNDNISIHPCFYSTAAQCGITFTEKDLYEEYREVKIGNDVWIGANVIIKGGITIGDGAVIASSAVVTKDVEPYSIVGGIPARHIRYRFDADKIEQLLKFKWWNKDIGWLKENVDLMQDIRNLNKN